MKTFLDLNLDAHLEKKGKLDYLPWAVVWREIIQLHPTAQWSVCEFNGMPLCYIQDGTAFVKTSITIEGQEKTCWLPVMNHQNAAIKNPDAFQVNKTIMRCLVKTAAMFGLGLNVYNGETFNEANDEAPKKAASAAPKPQMTPKEWAKQQINLLMTLDKDGIDKWKAANVKLIDKLQSTDLDAYNDLMDATR